MSNLHSTWHSRPLHKCTNNNVYLMIHFKAFLFISLLKCIFYTQFVWRMHRKSQNECIHNSNRISHHVRMRHLRLWTFHFANCKLPKRNEYVIGCDVDYYYHYPKRNVNIEMIAFPTISWFDCLCRPKRLRLVMVSEKSKATFHPFVITIIIVLGSAPTHWI